MEIILLRERDFDEFFIMPNEAERKDICLQDGVELASRPARPITERSLIKNMKMTLTTPHKS